MKVALELPPHMGRVELYLAQFRGHDVFIAKPGIIEFEKSNFRGDPWLTMEPQAMLEFHESLTRELQRLGLIRPTPTDDEIKSLEYQLQDAKQVRDKLFGLVDSLKPIPIAKPAGPHYRGDSIGG